MRSILVSMSMLSFCFTPLTMQAVEKSLEALIGEDGHLVGASPRTSADRNISVRLSTAHLPDSYTEKTLVYDAITQNELATFTTKDVWSHHPYRYSVGVFYNNAKELVSFNFGTGLTFTRFTNELSFVGTTRKYRLHENGVFIEPGVALNVNPHLSVELGVPLGVGLASYRQNGGAGAIQIVTKGYYLEHGVVARPVFRFDQLQAYVEVGWLKNTAVLRPASSTPGFLVDSTLQTRGSFMGLGIGYAF